MTKKTEHYDMKPLQKDLQTPKQNLDEFANVTKRVLGYLPNIISKKHKAGDYTILPSIVAGWERGWRGRRP